MVELQKERENPRKSEGENILSAVSFPKGLQWWGLSQAEVRSLEFHVYFPHGWQGPKDLGHLLLLSQAH